jgi:hypothetical protein
MTSNIAFINNRTGYVHFVDKAGNTGSVFVQSTCIKDPSVTAYAIP